MSDALVGAVVGGLIGIVGTLAATALSARLERAKRRHDHAIAQIGNTVTVLDAWAELGNVLLGALSEREATGEVSDWAQTKISRAQEKLRETDRIWDWSVDSIPGPEARELLRFCMDIHGGPGILGVMAPRLGTPGDGIARLGELQRTVRASAAARVRELS